MYVQICNKYTHVTSHTYIYIYTYIHTLHYITLHYITLHYITLHACIHTYIHTYYIYIIVYNYLIYILYLDRVDQPISSNIVTVLLETAWHRLVPCVFLQATSIRMHMRLTSNSIAWMRAHLECGEFHVKATKWLTNMCIYIYMII